MFGEYALYADGRVVALVCDDQLYIKILPESAVLEALCEKESPYPGARLHYLVEETMLSEIDDLPDVLQNIASGLPSKKPKKPKTYRRND